MRDYHPFGECLSESLDVITLVQCAKGRRGSVRNSLQFFPPNDRESSAGQRMCARAQRSRYLICQLHRHAHRASLQQKQGKWSG